MKFRGILDHPLSRPFLACLAVMFATAWAWSFRLLPNASGFGFLTTGDLFLYFYPMLEKGYSHLRSGQLFLWNPNQMGGMPGMATMQAGFLYPLHLIYLVLPTATAMGVSAFLHTLIAGLGMLVLCRAWSVSWLASSTAASYFALASVLPLFAWPPGMEAQAWLPLGIAAIERIGIRDDRRAFPWLVAAVCMPFLAGGYQTSVGMYYCYALFMLFTLVRRGTREGFRSGWVAGVMASFLVGTTIGVLCTAPQLLPTLELSALGARQTTSLTVQQVLANSIPKTDLSLLAHQIWSPPSDFGELILYLGLGVFILGAAGIPRAGLLSIPLLFLVTFGLLSIALPEWFLSLRAILPALGWFRIPAREVFLAKFALSLLLAFGIDQCLSRGQGVGKRWGSVALALLVGSSPFFLKDSSPTLLATSIAVLSAVVLCAWRTVVPLKVVTIVAVVALLANDMLGNAMNDFATPYTLGGREHAMDPRGFDGEAVHRAVAERAGYSRSLVFDLRTIKGPMLFGGYSPIDYDPLVISTFHECTEHARTLGHADDQASQRLHLGAPADLSVLLLPPTRLCLDLTSVRYAAIPRLLTLTQPVEAPWSLDDYELPAWTPEEPTFILLENSAALPRAFGVYAAECAATSKKQLDLLFAPDFDPRRSVVLPAGPACDGTTNTPPDLPSPQVEIEDYQDTRVRISATFPTSGFLVLTDSFYPGWTAEVNGQAAEIVQANTMSRAVRVPAGKLSVEFTYTPVALYAGFGLAALGGLLGVVFWRYRGRSG